MNVQISYGEVRSQEIKRGRMQRAVSGEISNRFAFLENLDAEADINRTWETIRENIQISAKESLHYYELKRQATVRRKVFRIIKQKKTNQTAVVTGSKRKNGDNLNNIKREANRNFRKKNENI
jgi:hypothetical protein